jgi:hypothetical protein
LEALYVIYMYSNPKLTDTPIQTPLLCSILCLCLCIDLVKPPNPFYSFLPKLTNKFCLKLGAADRVQGNKFSGHPDFLWALPDRLWVGVGRFSARAIKNHIPWVCKRHCKFSSPFNRHGYGDGESQRLKGISYRVSKVNTAGCCCLPRHCPWFWMQQGVLWEVGGGGNLSFWWVSGERRWWAMDLCKCLSSLYEFHPVAGIIFSLYLYAFWCRVMVKKKTTHNVTINRILNQWQATPSPLCPHWIQFPACPNRLRFKNPYW